MLSRIDIHGVGAFYVSAGKEDNFLKNAGDVDIVVPQGFDKSG
jgi:hypothetical protein